MPRSTRLGVDELRARQASAAADILTMGITFTVYSDGGGHRPGVAVRRDPPGHRGRTSGRASSAGSCSGCVALNLFIDDVYNDQRIVADGVFPAELLDDSANFRPECQGVHPKFGVWAHISRQRPRPRRRRHDVRARGQPARAVGRQLRAREPGRRQAGVRRPVRPPEHRPGRRLHRRAHKLLALAGARRGRRAVDRRAHAGHLQLGLLRALVPRPADGRDARRGRRPLRRATTTACTCARSTGSSGSTSIYRRIDDLFLDPEVFRPDSTLGVPGLMRAWKAGNVGIANAPGAGVADDKVVYAWVPDIIRYYLGEEPLIAERADVPLPVRRRAPVRARQPRASSCVKPANESGGYGILIGNRATRRAARGRSAAAIEADPRNWVAQPILQLSTAPTLCDDGDRAPPRRPAAVHPHRRDAATSPPAG